MEDDQPEAKHLPGGAIRGDRGASWVHLAAKARPGDAHGTYAVSLSPSLRRSHQETSPAGLTPGGAFLASVIFWERLRGP